MRLSDYQNNIYFGNFYKTIRVKSKKNLGISNVLKDLHLKYLALSTFIYFVVTHCNFDSF